MVLKSILKSKKKSKRKSKPKPRKRPKKARRKPRKRLKKRKKVRARKVKAKKRVRKKVRVRKVKKKVRKAKPKKARKVARKPKLPLIEKMHDRKAYELVRTARIPVVRTIFCRNEKQLNEALKKVGMPAVLKVSGTKIIRKSEVGGVITINSPEEAVAAFNKFMKMKNADGVLVQKHASGIEMIVAAKAEPHFGHFVSVSLGGRYADVLKDVSHRVCPIDTATAEAMLKELRGYSVLSGAGGSRPVSTRALADMISRISRFVIKNRLKELEISPVFCTSEGCQAADIRIIK